ncbi:hypothetical protein BU26DRAFT_274296 [Trematosphaeria pertusa]|uniref:Uncharacterized protein n=1 Tax=Trematosphaeria pertusa TaxID=390896 RepID=A0A6A6ILN9_9PLEO|nr:uncharacterized protein BU26DRAFT_274296 [Trematosphaeria pertusa]KAF2250988.1 hypothetical protein BU26DRAFT_274296 [Trematosphaeria pertusa]
MHFFTTFAFFPTLLTTFSILDRLVFSFDFAADFLDCLLNPSLLLLLAFVQRLPTSRPWQHGLDIFPGLHLYGAHQAEKSFHPRCTLL